MSSVFFNLLWWSLGRIGNLLHLDFQEMFQVLRVTATIIFLLITYRFCRIFFLGPYKGRIAFLIILLSSGFGWVLVLLKYTIANGELYYPLDVFIAEGNTFLCIMGYPHFIAAALYIFILDLILSGEKRNTISICGRCRCIGDQRD